MLHFSTSMDGAYIHPWRGHFIWQEITKKYGHILQRIRAIHLYVGSIIFLREMSIPLKLKQTKTKQRTENI